MKDFKVGDRVQLNNLFGNPNEEAGVRDGEIVSITPSKKVKPSDWWNRSKKDQEDFFPLATVKWEDGSQSDVDVTVTKLDLRDNELERKFRIEANTVMKLINKQLDIASAALNEAEKLSNEHGIPFNSGISPLCQSFFPRSFDEKFEGLDVELVYDITEANQGYDSGWEHSAVC